VPPQTQLIWTTDTLFLATSAPKRPTFDLESPRVEVVQWPNDALAIWPPDDRRVVHEHWENAAFSADGAHVCAAGDNFLLTFPYGDDSAVENVFTTKPWEGFGFRCAVSNDGKRLARGYLTESYFDGFGSAGHKGWGYDVWEIGRETPLLWEYQWDDEDLVVHPAISGDGALSAFSLGPEIVIHDNAQPEVELSTLTLCAKIDALAFSPTSRSIVVLTEAWELELWDF